MTDNLPELIIRSDPDKPIPRLEDLTDPHEKARLLLAHIVGGFYCGGPAAFERIQAERLVDVLKEIEAQENQPRPQESDMVYTHYWTQPRDFTSAEWKQVQDAFSKLFDTTIVELADSIGDPGTSPEITSNSIAFNGDAGANEDYDTFTVYRNIPVDGWDYCRTGQRPYDGVVVASLIYLHSIWGWDVKSDGGALEWEDGLQLAEEAWPELSSQLRNPIPEHAS